MPSINCGISITKIDSTCSVLCPLKLTRLIDTCSDTGPDTCPETCVDICLWLDLCYTNEEVEVFHNYICRFQI